MAIDFQAEGSKGGIDFQPEPVVPPASPSLMGPIPGSQYGLPQFRAQSDFMPESTLPKELGADIGDLLDYGAEKFYDVAPKTASFTTDLVRDMTPAGLLNTPTRIENIMREFGGGQPVNEPFAPGKPFFPIPEPKGTGVVAGLGRLAAKNINALQTPEMAVEAPLAATPLGRLLFAEQMGTHLPESVEESATTLGSNLKPTPADYITNIGQPAVEAGMTALLSKGPKLEPIMPEVKPYEVSPDVEAAAAQGGAPQRQLGIRIPQNPLDAPGTAPVVEDALKQAQGQYVSVPGETPPIDRLGLQEAPIQAAPGLEPTGRPGNLLSSDPSLKFQFRTPEETPESLRSAENIRLAEAGGNPVIDRPAPEFRNQPLQTQEEIVRDRLARRSVDEILSKPSEVKRQVVDEITGVGRKKVPLSAAEQTIFNEIWDREVSKYQKGAPNAEGVREDQGQPGKPGQAPEGGEADSGGNVQQTPPRTPTGGVGGEGNKAPAKVEETAFESNKSLVDRTEVSQRDDAFKKRAEALKQVSKSLKPGDIVIDEDGVRRVVRDVAKDGTLFVDKEGGNDRTGYEFGLRPEMNVERGSTGKIINESDLKYPQGGGRPTPTEGWAKSLLPKLKDQSTWLDIFDVAADGKVALTNTAERLGMALREMGASALPILRDVMKTRRKVIDEAKANYDSPNEAVKMKAIRDITSSQFFSEAVEAATNNQKTEQFYKGKVDPIEIPEGDKSFDEIPQIKEFREERDAAAAKPLEFEGATALDPATGVPLSATDSLINKLEGLKYGEDAQGRIVNPKGQMFTLPDPEAIKMIGKGIWNNAIDVAIAAIKAGKAIGAGIDEALSYLKKNARGFDEARIRTNLNSLLEKETQGQQTAPKAPAQQVVPNPSEPVDLYKGVPKEAQIKPGNPETGSVGLVGKSFNAVRNFLTNAHDYTTIDPIPKLTRAGIQNEAVQHAYARVAVPRMVDDMLSRVFGKEINDPEAMSRTMDIMNKDDILGGYDEFLRRASADLAAGDQAGYRKWLRMAESVGSKQDLEALARDVNAAKNDPVISRHIEQWKSIVSPELDTLYNEMKGLDPNTPREGRGRVFGSRVNLLPKADEGKWIESLNDQDKPMPEPSSSNYRNPNAKRDRFDRLAKFTGDYSTNPAAVLSNVLSPRWNEVTKVRMYNALVKSGKATWVEPGAPMPEAIGGEPAARLPVKVPETNESGVTRQVERTLAVPKSLVSEIRGVLDTDLSMRRHPVADALTKVQLAQLADAFTHTKNLHSVITTAQGTKSMWTDVAKKLPGIATADAAVRIAKTVYDIHSGSPEMKAELAFLGKNGMLREKYPATGLQKITKMQDMIHEVDTASRVIMNRFYDNLIDRKLAKDDMVQRRKFVQQVGEYNKRLMAPLMKNLSRSGFSPFVVAGRNFNRFGRRTLTGSYGFEAADNAAAAKMRLVNLATTASVFVIPMMVHYLLHGNLYGRPGTPLGAIDMGGKEDAKGGHKVLDLAQLYGVRRGMRATGIESIAQGLHDGKSGSEIVDKAIGDVVSTAAHPWVGPAIGFGYSALTGSRLDLRGGPNPIEARKVGPGESQKAENARVALKNQNPLVYSLIRPLIGDTERSFGQDLAKDFLQSPYGALGIRDVKSPALMKANEILRQSIPVGGTPAERARQRIAESNTVSDIRDGKTTLDKAIESGKIAQKDVNDVRERLAQTPLQYSIRRMSSDQVQEVMKLASPKEKAEIKDFAEIKRLQKQSTDESNKLGAAAEVAVSTSANFREAFDKFKAQGQPTAAGVERLQEMYIAKQAGATPRDRAVLALPVKERAEFIKSEISNLPRDGKLQVLREYAKKKILTDAVAEQLLQSGFRP